jgi:Tol biopolymer transport system component
MRRMMLLLVVVAVAAVALALVQLGDSATDQGLLVFTSVRAPDVTGGAKADEFPNLFTLRPDGTGLRQLTRAREAHGDPEWSPDGRQIVYSRGVVTGCHHGSCDNYGVAEIWVIDAAGTNARRLTHELPPFQAEQDQTMDLSPTWSPDGKQIAFVHQKTFDTSPKDGVYVVGVDGRGLHRVSGELHWVASPTWSPDGKTLAFTMGGEPEPELALLDLQTGEVSYRRSASGPSWSPDGNTLAYVASSKLALLDLQTGHVTYGSPATEVLWSPNGRWLAITRSNGVFIRSNGVFIVAPRGGLARRIVDLSYVSRLSWSPDSRHLAFSAIQPDRANLMLLRCSRVACRCRGCVGSSATHLCR